MLTHWGNPNRTIKDLEQLSRQIEKMVLNGARGERQHPEPNALFDIRLVDRGEALCVWAEMPGVDADDLKIEAARQNVTVSGRRTTAIPSGYTAHLRERRTTEFTRSFALPCRVDLERARAQLKNGVLTLELPKHPEETTKSIEVQVEPN